MLSIASSHCILTISRDFYPKIRRRLQLKISAATWNWNDSTWLVAAKSNKSTSRLNGGDSQVYYFRLNFGLSQYPADWSF